MSDLVPLLVISPHLDDAVIACGRTLAAHPGSVVVTVFTGSRKSFGTVTEWDALCGFEAGQDVMAVRRSEDSVALRRLRSRSRWMDALDTSYRLLEGVDEQGLTDAVASEIGSIGPSAVLIPLGIYHPDHILASEISLAAMERAGRRRWLMYGDVYDRSMPHLARRRLDELELRFEMSPVRLPLGSRSARLRAIAAYRSQRAGLGGFRRVVRSRWSAPERLWACAPR